MKSSMKRIVLSFKRLSQKPHFKYFKLIQSWFKFERHTSYSTHSAYIFTHTALDANPIVWGHLDEVEKVLGLESCCSNPVVGFFWTLICSTGQNPSLTYLIIDSYIDFSTFLLLLCCRCAFARRVKLGGRGITRKERKKAEHYGVFPFSGDDDDVDCCAGFVSAQEVRASERASESSEAENERDLFFCVRGTTEGSRRTHTLPIRILMRLLLTKKMAGSLLTYCTWLVITEVWDLKRGHHT